MEWFYLIGRLFFAVRVNLVTETPSTIRMRCSMKYICSYYSMESERVRCGKFPTEQHQKYHKYIIQCPDLIPFYIKVGKLHCEARFLCPFRFQK